MPESRNNKTHKERTSKRGAKRAEFRNAFKSIINRAAVSRGTHNVIPTGLQTSGETLFQSEGIPPENRETPSESLQNDLEPITP